MPDVVNHPNPHVQLFLSLTAEITENILLTTVFQRITIAPVSERAGWLDLRCFVVIFNGCQPDNANTCDGNCGRGWRRLVKRI